MYGCASGGGSSTSSVNLGLKVPNACTPVRTPHEAPTRFYNKLNQKLDEALRLYKGMSRLSPPVSLRALRKASATQYTGQAVNWSHSEREFKGVSPLRFDTEALHEIIYKAFKNKPKYKLYIERLCKKLCTRLCTDARAI